MRFKERLADRILTREAYQDIVGLIQQCEEWGSVESEGGRVTFELTPNSGIRIELRLIEDKQ